MIYIVRRAQFDGALRVFYVLLEKITVLEPDLFWRAGQVHVNPAIHFRLPKSVFQTRIGSGGRHCRNRRENAKKKPFKESLHGSITAQLPGRGKMEDWWNLLPLTPFQSAN